MGCDYIWKFGEHKGIKCAREPVLEDGKCFWHSTVPNKIYPGDAPPKSELQALVDEGHSLEGFVLVDMDLRNISLKGANLRRALLREARLHKSKFTECDFYQADLRGSKLIGAMFRHCDLTLADFEGAIMQEADFSGSNLYEANLQDAELEGAKLIDVNLGGATLINANLFGTDLQYSNLHDAIFENANLECANLSYADLKGAVLLNIDYNPLTLIKDMRNLELAHQAPPEWLKALQKKKFEEVVSPIKFDKSQIPMVQRSIANLRNDDLFGDNNEYRIIKKIGKGGYAFVYKVEDLTDEENPIKAIKILDPHLGADQLTIKRFKQEGLIGKKVRNPRIVVTYDFKYTNKYDTFYLIMEYVQGTDLRRVIRKYQKQKKSVPFKMCLSLFYQICQGLKVAHAEGIVHRDLKPGNILIRTDGTAVLTDFGLSKITATLETSMHIQTKTGTVMGTFEYMSPEHVTSMDIDERSDIYSLGVVIYELFTLKMPYQGDNLLAWVHVIRGKNPEPPSNINPDIPSWLDKMVLKCMAKKVSERYQTVDEIIADIKVNIKR